MDEQNNSNVDEVKEKEDRLRQEPENQSKKTLYKMLGVVLLLLCFSTVFGFIKNSVVSPTEEKTNTTEAVKNVQKNNETNISYKNEDTKDKPTQSQPPAPQFQGSSLEEENRARERAAALEREQQKSKELGRKSKIKFDLGEKKTAPKGQSENNYYNSQQDTYYVEVVE